MRKNDSREKRGTLDLASFIGSVKVKEAGVIVIHIHVSYGFHDGMVNDNQVSTVPTRGRGSWPQMK